MSFVSLTVIILSVVAMAATGAAFKPGDWYAALDKPGWTPPDWMFPVVWTTLYVMIVIAGWLIWEQAGWTLAMGFWALQVILNSAWSWLFFGMKRMDLAFVDVSLLWLGIVGFIVTAWPLSTLAAGLFLPYLLWVTVAAALNLKVWRMNPNAAPA